MYKNVCNFEKKIVVVLFEGYLRTYFIFINWFGVIYFFLFYLGLGRSRPIADVASYRCLKRDRDDETRKTMKRAHSTFTRLLAVDRSTSIANVVPCRFLKSDLADKKRKSMNRAQKTFTMTSRHRSLQFHR